MYSTPPPPPPPRVPTIISSAQNLLSNHTIRLLLLLLFQRVLFHLEHLYFLECIVSCEPPFSISVSHLHWRVVQQHCLSFTALLFICWAADNANSWCVAVTADNQLITALTAYNNRPHVRLYHHGAVHDQRHPYHHNMR